MCVYERIRGVFVKILFKKLFVFLFQIFAVNSIKFLIQIILYRMFCSPHGNLGRYKMCLISTNSTSFITDYYFPIGLE